MREPADLRHAARRSFVSLIAIFYLLAIPSPDYYSALAQVVSAVEIQSSLTLAAVRGGSAGPPLVGVSPVNRVNPVFGMTFDAFPRVENGVPVFRGIRDGRFVPAARRPNEMSAVSRQGTSATRARPLEQTTSDAPSDDGTPADESSREAKAVPRGTPPRSRPIGLDPASAEGRLVSHPEAVALTPAEAAAMGPEALRGAGQRGMDAVLRTESAADPIFGGSVRRDNFGSMLSGAGLGADRSPGSRKSFGVSSFTRGSVQFPARLSHDVPLSPKEEKIDRGFYRKAWDLLAGPFRVLPDKERNREFWKFLIGQMFLSLAVSFHYTALPSLIAPTKAAAKNIGYNRAVNWSAQAVSSFSTGPMIDQSSLKRVLVWPYLGRSVLLMLVPILFFSAHGITVVFPLLSFFIMFQGVIFLHGFLQSTGLNAASVAFNRILAEDMDHYNKANAVYNVVTNLAGVMGPILAGIFISAMLAAFGSIGGPLVGNALAYGVYSLLALGVGTFYAFFLRLPRDELVTAQRKLAGKLMKGSDRRPRVRGIGARQDEGAPVLLVEVAGDPNDVQDIPAEFLGYRVRAVPQRKRIAELIKGIRLTWNDRFLKLTTLFSTLETMAADSLIFAAVPRFIADVLGLGTAPLPGIRGLPFLGGLLGGMPGQGLAFGLFLASSSLGLGLSSLSMMHSRDRSGQELEMRLADFRGRLTARENLPAAVVGAADEAVHNVISRILEEYRDGWIANPALERTLSEFKRAILEKAAVEIDRQAFQGRRGAAEMERLMADTGLDAGIGEWAGHHFEALTREAGKEARTGLNRMERQGRWTSILYGLGSLAYWGVFFSAGIWGSVGWMLASAALQGAGNIVWASLITRRLQNHYRNDQGKIYSAQSLYALAFSMAGALMFSSMMAVLPTETALWVVGGTMTVVGALHIIEPFVVLPINRAPDSARKSRS